MMPPATPSEQSRWWVDRWLELLDSYRFKKRLERARNYAREGNVLELRFTDSDLQALVQGTDPQPYRVLLHLDLFSDEDWHYITADLATKASYSAQLLAGAMPESIEQVFIQNGLNLFPFNLGEVHARCSCPDKANPCKHIGAVYYQLADQFREDPFVIFQLRGRTRAQLLKQLRTYRRRSPEELADYAAFNTAGSPELSHKEPQPPTPDASSSGKVQESKTQKLTKQELQAAFQQFWQHKTSLPEDSVVIVPHDSLLTVRAIGGFATPL